jgi:DNA-directed RNA polymerase specialized sigma24 family protein
LDKAVTAINWPAFRDMFLVKYFLEGILNREEMEFVKLEQGNMSVEEYAASLRSRLSTIHSMLERQEKSLSVSSSKWDSG